MKKVFSLTNKEMSFKMRLHFPRIELERHVQMTLTRAGCLLGAHAALHIGMQFGTNFLQSNLAYISKPLKMVILFDAIIPTTSEICIKEII